MSAPETNVKKQERQHKAPLVGMAWVIAFAVVLLVALFIYLSASGNEPGNNTSIDAEDGAATATQ